MYRLFIPAGAAGASKIYFDFWNTANSGILVEVLAVLPIVSGAVAVTGVLGVDLFLNRTTAVGTGGTAATLEGTSQTAATFTCVSGSQPLHGLISARLAPSGGATAGAVICSRSVFTEETNAGSYTPPMDMVRNWYTDIPGLIVPAGSGFAVTQGSVASVGNVGFDVIFKLR